MMFFKRDRCRTIWLRRVTLAAKRLGRLIRYPDFRQKTACIKLGEHAGIDRIGLDLRIGDDAHLFWIRDHNFLDMRRDHRSD